MGQVIDFWSARVLPSVMLAEAKCRCSNCGSDLWHVSRSGEVCCADCDEACPLRLQAKE